MSIYDELRKCSGFQWDEHNFQKNWDKHKVTPSECEQIFFNQPLVIADDAKHSKPEKRFFALGKTDLEKKLFIVFTLRSKFIRVISARRMSQREKRGYDDHEKQ